MLLALAGGFFCVYVINVWIGSFGGTPFFGAVGEMLCLFAVSISFTAAVLRKEAEKKASK
ncbi:hypothetical protein GCM10011316_15060 [Roseibium aquae]|uniref:Uncharacterized protein n=1 Tax=Roseibium aquae TaxID=1323746 RepID=A0A916TGH4_9HYPH|nr:hypothetical protein GCM10011316_15060 [Roseibium aquae]